MSTETDPLKTALADDTTRTALWLAIESGHWADFQIARALIRHTDPNAVRALTHRLGTRA